MPLLTEAEVRAAARVETARLNKSARVVLAETARTSLTSFDVFLSHSRLDAEIVVGTKRVLEDTGKTVYVDWIDDPQLDRSNVTAATASKLRQRMRQCASLMYVHSGNASKSRWMPWELGYFDGYNGNVAILPIVQTPGQLDYKGEEYLGLYPYVDVTGRTSSSPGGVWIHRDRGTYKSFTDWRASSEKLRPAA